MSLSLRQILQNNELSTPTLDEDPFLIAHPTYPISYIAYTRTNDNNIKNIEIRVLNITLEDKDASVQQSLTLVNDNSWNYIDPYLLIQGSFLYIAYAKEINKIKNSFSDSNKGQYNVYIRVYNILSNGSLIYSGELIDNYNSNVFYRNDAICSGNVKPVLAYHLDTNNLVLGWQSHGDRRGIGSYTHTFRGGIGSSYSNITFAIFNINGSIRTFRRTFKNTQLNAINSSININVKLPNSNILTYSSYIYGMVYHALSKQIIITAYCGQKGLGMILGFMSITGTTPTVSLSTIIDSRIYSNMIIDATSRQNIISINNTIYYICSTKPISNTTSFIPGISINSNNAWVNKSTYQNVIVGYKWTSGTIWNLLACSFNTNINTNDNDIYASLSYDLNNKLIFIAYQTAGTIKGINNVEIKNTGSSDIVTIFLDLLLIPIYTYQSSDINTNLRERFPSVISSNGYSYIGYVSDGSVSKNTSVGNTDIVIAKFKPFYVPDVEVFTAIESINSIKLYWITNKDEKIDQFILNYKEFDQQDTSYKYLNRVILGSEESIILYTYNERPPTMSYTDITYNNYILKEGFKYTFKIEPVANGLFGRSVTCDAITLSDYKFQIIKDGISNIIDISYTLNNNIIESTIYPEQQNIDIVNRSN